MGSKKTKKLNFKIINSNNFIAFLKKFKMVDKSVPLELDGDNFFGKVVTSDKSVMKYVHININEAMEGELPPARLKIGILDISKLIDVFKYFGPEEQLNLSVDAEPYDNELIATRLHFYNSSIDIFINCADISLLSYIDDEVQQKIHSAEGAEVDFEVSRETFQKLSSLTGIDSNPEELLNFDVKEDEVRARGDSFQYQIFKGKKINGFKAPKSYTIYKKQFSYIDLESSMIYFHNNRIFIKSSESGSMIAIGLVEI